MSKVSAYCKIIEYIFFSRYSIGSVEIAFRRDELTGAANALCIPIPKNVGDIVYTFRHREALPDSIIATQPKSQEWIIESGGRGKYIFSLSTINRITPRDGLPVIEIADHTPANIRQLGSKDEQGLLAILERNRVIGLHLNIRESLLQYHLRSALRNGTQIETDAIYAGEDRDGAQYIVPVQAKRGADQISVTQVRQDIAYCCKVYPKRCCRPVTIKFMDKDTFAMLEIAERGNELKVVNERHYRLVA